MRNDTRPTKRDLIRFWSKVLKGPDCWLWIGTSTVYGMFKMSKEIHQAHRLAFRITNPDIDIAEKHLHHKCRNKLCVNPNHLEVMSPQKHVSITNTKEFCKNGHLLSSDNVYEYVRRNGIFRQCKKCTKIRSDFQTEIERERR